MRKKQFFQGEIDNYPENKGDGYVFYGHPWPETHKESLGGIIQESSLFHGFREPFDIYRNIEVTRGELQCDNQGCSVRLDFEFLQRLSQGEQHKGDECNNVAGFAIKGEEEKCQEGQGMPCGTLCEVLGEGL